jgi:RNA polymerase sigma-70 factor (ECF subfamily)
MLMSLSPRPGILSRTLGRRVDVREERVVGLDVAALYRRYGDMVLRRCRSLLGNEADAEEVAQEIFLKLHRSSKGFRGEASPSTYLFKATTTTCLNRLRTRRRRREDLVDELPPAPHDDGLIDAVELRQLIDIVLADEDERTTACVIYHFVDGMTHDETGKMLGISGAAVRKRIGKFKTKMKGAKPSWMEEL